MSKLSSLQAREFINRLDQLKDLCTNLALSVKAGLIPPQITEICEIGAEELLDNDRELSSNSTR